MSGYISIKNGRKGGRPKSEKNISFLDDCNLVILTSEQYNVLLKKYGENLIKTAISILENWLKTSVYAEKYRGKNNYGHFRSDGWLINTAKTISAS